MKRIKSSSKKKNKWCQNYNGSRTLPIKSIWKIKLSWKSIRLSNRSMKSKRKTRTCSWRSFWWRKKRMLSLSPKSSNIKNYWMRFPKKWNKIRLNQTNLKFFFNRVLIRWIQVNFPRELVRMLIKIQQKEWTQILETRDTRIQESNKCLIKNMKIQLIIFIMWSTNKGKE